MPPKSDIPTVDGVVADGSMLINSAKPSKKDQTFVEYGLQVFLTKISKLSTNAQRIDIVWDIYLEESLKASTRSSHGKGDKKKNGGKYLNSAKMGVISQKRREQNRIIHILGASHDLVFLFRQNTAMDNGKFHC